MNKREFKTCSVKYFVLLTTYLTWVIDKACRIATHGGIHYQIVVDLEHVAANAATIIIPLPLVSQRWAYQLASVFDNHFTCLKMMMISSFLELERERHTYPLQCPWCSRDRVHGYANGRRQHNPCRSPWVYDTSWPWADCCRFRVCKWFKFVYINIYVYSDWV